MLDVTRNPVVISDAAEALWEAGDRAKRAGFEDLAGTLYDIYGMLFVEVGNE